MTQFKYRSLEPTPEAKSVYCRWLTQLDESFSRHKDPKVRSEKVKDELNQLYLAKPAAGKIVSTLISELPFNVLELSFNPLNVTLEPEYYGDIDEKKYAERKPLIWFWQMFDRSPVALNHWLGFRFRAMLGRHIFKSLGKNVKMFHGIEFSFGYNLNIEDDCVIHKYVMLDDRAELTIKRGSSISDYANVYTHSHDVHEQANVSLHPVTLGPAARITYHATVLAGNNIGENAMLTALGVATHPVPDFTVSGGIPARPIREKDRSRIKADAKPQPQADSEDRKPEGKRVVDDVDDRGCGEQASGEKA
jgi:acetyltransferase-like isoleucine patch superfamily enzyme